MSMYLEWHDLLVPGLTHSLQTTKILEKIEINTFMSASENWEEIRSTQVKG